jgi:hypothetical protein
MEAQEAGGGMCYSPEADVIAGLVVGAVGVDAIRHVDDRRYLALAAVPLVLAAHQFIEAVAWWGLRGDVSADARDFATSMYLLIALGIVPILVPYAAMRCEPSPRRRRAMEPFVALGFCVGFVLVASLAGGPSGAAIGGRFIAYDVTVPAGGILAVCYATAVCVPLVVSSHRRIRLLGWLNLPAFVLLSLLLHQGVISLWCIWAAVTSVVIAIQVRTPVGLGTTRFWHEGPRGTGATSTPLGRSVDGTRITAVSPAGRERLSRIGNGMVTSFRHAVGRDGPPPGPRPGGHRGPGGDRVDG